MAELVQLKCRNCSAPFPVGGTRCEFCGSSGFVESAPRDTANIADMSAIPRSPAAKWEPPPQPSFAGCLSLVLGVGIGLLALLFVLHNPPGNKISLILTAPVTIAFLLPGISNRFPGARGVTWILSGGLFVFVGIWVFREVRIIPAIIAYVGLGVLFIFFGIGHLQLQLDKRKRGMPSSS